MKKQIEAKIRDSLASNLSVLGSNLELIDTEFYIPNMDTTRCFIDILARDEENNYIIIEVKRSNQASRQALHEINKYTEAIKAKYKVTKGEVKSIIVSTEWKELFVPFSVFCNETNQTILGLKIKVNDNYETISVEKVIPCKIKDGRIFSPIHECNLYYTRENLEKGINSHIEILKNKNINDYVLVILKISDYFKNLLSPRSSSTNHFPICNFMIYTGFQRLSKKEYIEVLKRDPYQLQETLDCAEDADEDDTLGQLENSILGNLEPFFYSDDCSEIGYPAKFASKILDKGQWQIERIIRSKSLKENILLTDEKIISELRGETGINHDFYKGNCNLNHRAKFKEVSAQAINAFKYNIVWQNDIKAFFELIEKESNGHLTIDIYFPNNILITLMKMSTTKEEPMNLFPSYTIHFKNEVYEKVFIGTFHWNKKHPNFLQIVHKYYNDKPESILLPMLWGGHEKNNSNIVEDLGLSYESYLIEKKNEETQFYHYSKYKFKKKHSIENGVIELINNSRDFVTQLAYIHYKYCPEVFPK